MASFQKSLTLDILSVKTILAKGSSNTTLPAFNVLTTDGNGGTNWISISTLNSSGPVFNTFNTTTSNGILSTFLASPYLNTFSIYPGSNTGVSIDPTATLNNAAINIYAKAFGQINVSGSQTINAFNNYSNVITSNINLIGNGLITISSISTTNTINISASNYTFSTISSFINNLQNTNSTISGNICSFNSPFSSFIYSAISSFSTAMGSTLLISQVNSGISSFSTAMGNTPNTLQMYSTISSFSTAMGNTPNTLQLYSTISSFSTSLGHIPTSSEINNYISSFSTAMGTTPNTIQVYSTISSFSTSLGNFLNITQLNSGISSFSTAIYTPNTLQINNSISSFSTSMGTTPSVLQMYSTISSFSTAMGSVLTIDKINSAISSFSTVVGKLSTFNISSVYTSEVFIKTNKQPFIQYGSTTTTSGGIANINLGVSYLDTSYAIQLTYISQLHPLSMLSTICAFAIYSNTFRINAHPSQLLYWTTYGNI